MENQNQNPPTPKGNPQQPKSNNKKNKKNKNKNNQKVEQEAGPKEPIQEQDFSLSQNQQNTSYHSKTSKNSKGSKDNTSLKGGESASSFKNGKNSARRSSRSGKGSNSGSSERILAKEIKQNMLSILDQMNFEGPQKESEYQPIQVQIENSADSAPIKKQKSALSNNSLTKKDAVKSNKKNRDSVLEENKKPPQIDTTMKKQDSKKHKGKTPNNNNYNSRGVGDNENQGNGGYGGQGYYGNQGGYENGGGNGGGNYRQPYNNHYDQYNNYNDQYYDDYGRDDGKKGNGGYYENQNQGYENRGRGGAGGGYQNQNNNQYYNNQNQNYKQGYQNNYNSGIRGFQNQKNQKYHDDRADNYEPRNDPKQHLQDDNLNPIKKQSSEPESDAPRIQIAQGKPVFVVDWDSNSVESFDLEKSEDGSNSKTLNQNSASFHKQDMDPELQEQAQQYNQMHEQMMRQQYGDNYNQEIIVMQGRRSGFLEQYIYSEEQLEEMKLQQQQKEMSMKPWDRDLQEMERYFLKTQEEENIKQNSNNPGLISSGQANLQIIQSLKEQNMKDIMSQYFNFGFQEDSYKVYVNQQILKFYDQSRITQVLHETGMDSGHKGKQKEQNILMYQQYQEQEQQREVFKQIREELRNAQTNMQHQIQQQLQQQQQQMQMQQFQQMQNMYHQQMTQGKTTSESGGSNQSQLPVMQPQPMPLPVQPLQPMQQPNPVIDSIIDQPNAQYNLSAPPIVNTNFYKQPVKQQTQQQKMQQMQTMLNTGVQQYNFNPQQDNNNIQMQQQVPAFQPDQQLKQNIQKSLGADSLKAKPFVPFGAK